MGENVTSEEGENPVISVILSDSGHICVPDRLRGRCGGEHGSSSGISLNL